MKVWFSGGAMIAALALGGCHNPTPASGSAPYEHGRYAGIGIYAADPLWSHMTVSEKPTNKAAATIADDRTIIVVIDSKTGEVRQCGNMSGYCVGMNPWAGAFASGRSAPLNLAKHAAELGDDEAVATNEVIAENASDGEH